MLASVCQYGNAKSRCEPLAKSSAESSPVRLRSGIQAVTNEFVSSGTCACAPSESEGITLNTTSDTLQADAPC
jgi:hypothetical protein